MLLKHEITAPATYASVRLGAVNPNGTFEFNILASDADGRTIYGAAQLPRAQAMQMTINILAATATLFDGLTADERERLRDLADAEPLFGRRVPAVD